MWVVLSVSRKVKFQSADQPDSVLTLLRNHAFTDSPISKLVRTRPDVLVFDPIRTLLPKLAFQSLGFPTANLTKILCSNPALLMRSLNNQLIPLCNYLKSKECYSSR